MQKYREGPRRHKKNSKLLSTGISGLLVRADGIHPLPESSHLYIESIFSKRGRGLVRIIY